MPDNKKGRSFVKNGNCGFPGIGENQEQKQEKSDTSVDDPDFSKFKNTPRASGAWDSTD